MEKTSEKEEEMIDRLSALPDVILHNILSFLNLKQAIQTCVLAKRWSELWASLPDLSFNSSDFSDSSTFSTFISNVLSTRKDCDVCKLQILSNTPLDASLMSTFIEYAVSHNVKHFLFLLPIFFFDSLWLSPKILQCKSVETLELVGVPFGDLPDDFTFSFPLLTSMHLHFCSFSYRSEYLAVADPFAGCPNLKFLTLENCEFASLKNPQNILSRPLFTTPETAPVVDVLKISGPQLDILHILGLEFSSASKRNEYLRIEIVAPKLKFWSYLDTNAVYFYGRDLSSLEHANVVVHLPHGIQKSGTFAEKEKVALDLIKMCNGLHNAQHVKLASFTIEALNLVPGLLERQPSPLRRLKSLSVLCESNFVIPAHVKTYLLGGTPHTVPVELELIGED